MHPQSASDMVNLFERSTASDCFDFSPRRLGGESIV